MLIAGGYFTILFSKDFIFVGQSQVLSQLEGKVQRFHLDPLPPGSTASPWSTHSSWVGHWYKLWTCTDTSTPLRVHSWWEDLVLVVSMLWVPHTTHTQTNHTQRHTHRPHTHTHHTQTHKPHTLRPHTHSHTLRPKTHTHTHTHTTHRTSLWLWPHPTDTSLTAVNDFLRVLTSGGKGNWAWLWGTVLNKLLFRQNS